MKSKNSIFEPFWALLPISKQTCIFLKNLLLSLLFYSRFLLLRGISEKPNEIIQGNVGYGSTGGSNGLIWDNKIKLTPRKLTKTFWFIIAIMIFAIIIFSSVIATKTENYLHIKV